MKMTKNNYQLLTLCPQTQLKFTLDEQVSLRINKDCPTGGT